MSSRQGDKERKWEGIYIYTIWIVESFVKGKSLLKDGSTCVWILSSRQP